MDVTVARHRVGSDPETGLSPLQTQLLTSPAPIRIAHAPTGAGKSYAFGRAVMSDQRVLFIVPTRRLAQNLLASLHEDLVRDAGWDPSAADRKLALWSSDATERLRAEGVTRIGPRRIREIFGLNTALPGGEMIVSVPEVVGHCLLRPYPGRSQTDAGIFDLITMFEHVVFDECHTISPRGFGLAGLIAKMVATDVPRRARISFLSATPLDIRPVLRRLEIPDDRIETLSETLTDTGRPVHGDVRLSIRDRPDMVALVREEIPAIAAEIEAGRQVVIIYNRLSDLRLHLAEMAELLAAAGVRPGRALLIDSIDDSRDGGIPMDFFEAGRHHQPDRFDVLVATASVEMGVTFRTRLLLMEPGFEPLNFLQRYGRAARGDQDGRVIARIDGGMTRKANWLRRLTAWAAAHDGETVHIDDLTAVLSQTARKAFADRPESGPHHFGNLPNRAAYTTGLYWNALMNHFSNQGHRRRHLMAAQPPPAKQVFALLRKVRAMADDRMFEKPARQWCDRFEEEVRTLRDIGRSVKIVSDGGGTAQAPELWLRRNTRILDRYPVMIDESGTEIIHIPGDLDDHLLADGRYVEPTREVRFPHTPYTATLKDGGELVDNWRRAFKEGRGPEALAWEKHPAAMAAADKLVALTGLVVCDDVAVESSSGDKGMGY
mgnify:CR=1 FL=1